jgi:hypothetical protein
VLWFLAGVQLSEPNMSGRWPMNDQAEGSRNEPYATSPSEHAVDRRAERDDPFERIPKRRHFVAAML